MDKPVESLRILMLEDTPSDAELEQMALRDAGMQFTSLRVDTREAFAHEIDAFKPDIILTDYRLPTFNGREALEYARRTHPHIPVVMVTGALGDEAAVELLKFGAKDYVLKDNLVRLAPAVNRALSEERGIHRRKRAERAKHESELRYRRLFEASRDGILILDADTGKIEDANPFILDLLAYTRDECIGKKLWEINLFTDVNHSKEAFKKLQASEHVRYDNLPLKTRDGQRREVEFISNVYQVNGDKLIQCNIRDITERKQAVDNLAANEALLRQFISHAPAAIAMLDTQMRYLQTSDRWLRDYHLAGQDIIGKSHYDVFPEIPQRWKDIHQRVLTGATEHCDEDAFPRADGSIDWLQWEALPWRKAGGEIGGLIFFTQVITERKQAEARITYLNRVYAMLSSINTLIVRVHDRAELFQAACRIAVENGGFSMAMISMVNRGSLKIVPVASAGKKDEIVKAVKGLLSSDELVARTMLARAIKGKQAIVSNDSQNDPQVLLGAQYAVAGVRSMAILPLIVAEEAMGALALYASEKEFFHKDEMALLTELVSDIAFAIDHLDKQAQIDYLAYYDVLTGLANRTLFHERLEQTIVHASEDDHRLALVLLDIERFKAINDTLGRPAGDAMLKELAARLAKYSADPGRVGRIDADHFAILVSDLQSEEDLARLIEQQVEEIFGPPFHLDQSELRAAARFGIAIYPADGTNADLLFRNAEVALKKAKTSSERYLFYDQKMNARVADNLILENQLRQALEHGEFVLYYQPKIRLANGKLTGAEALIRWNDPRTGLVPPGKFIPILEETGMIYEIGRWALHQAIADNLRWLDAGLPAVRIAVNVSPLQLRHHGFIAEIEQAIGIDPRAAAGLELEITESLIMEDIALSIANLRAIRALGVTIAIDDFGTGFSSLSYLAKLPVDTLKIDRSFVIDITSGTEGLALVSTIISLAHALKLAVVAEGVDSEEQSHLLRLLSCDEMQGFLFSEPVPGEVFESRFLARPAG